MPNGSVFPAFFVPGEKSPFKKKFSRVARCMVRLGIDWYISQPFGFKTIHHNLNLVHCCLTYSHLNRVLFFRGGGGDTWTSKNLLKSMLILIIQKVFLEAFFK